MEPSIAHEFTLRYGSYVAAAKALGVNESTVRRSAKKHKSSVATIRSNHTICAGKRVLLIGDTHIPAEHPDYLEFVCCVRDHYQIDTAIHVGDVIDFHAMSYHESDPDLPSAGDELDAAKESLQEWAAEFPTLHITAGNHDKIPARKALTHGLPKAFLRGFNELFDLPETWEWTPRPITFELRCGMPVVVQHAVSSSLEAGAKHLRTASLIQGHHHFTAGVAWKTAPQWRLFFLSVGCGVNPSHPGMAYADTGMLKMPCLGCGVVLDGYAAHLPMWLDDNGRWNGSLPSLP